MPKISVIVPVYNTEKYLDECVNSVLMQSFKEWEMLLMDDGSTDSSSTICDRYALLDKRINVVHKKNTGVSDTRNKALLLAQSEFVTFLDSDDYWVNNNVLAVLYDNALKHQLDIIRGDFFEVDGIGRRRNFKKNRYRDKYANIVMGYYDFLNKIVCREYFLTFHLLRKSLFTDCLFCVHRKYMEDAEIYMKLINKSLRCMYLPIEIYAYRKYENSVTEKFEVSLFNDAFDFSRICLQLAQLNTKKECRNFLLKEGVNNFMENIHHISVNRHMMDNLDYWLRRWKLEELKSDVTKFVVERFKILLYPQVLLSLNNMILFYKIKYRLKTELKTLINHCLVCYKK